MDYISPTSWIVYNNFVNENQQPIEFSNHRFLLEPFDDMHDDIVVRKSAQVGFSVLSILKSFWLARYYESGLNTIYVLPTQDIVKSFVNPKVDPLIASNEKLAGLVSRDSVTLKQIGNRFVHYKGSSSQREAISTSADILCIDEYDRCIDMDVLNIYDSRLQASNYAWRWRFSNPSEKGFGVDSLFADSDQRHWFVKCHHCNYNWYMDFARDDTIKVHYVDRQRRIYACGKCHKELSDSDRRNGEWIAKYPGSARHGYWFSQMIAPWVTAGRILDQERESGIQMFYNFVLGKAYTPSDIVVNRETILRATAPSIINKTDVVMGVDQDAGGQYFVAMTPQGIFAHGYVKSWEEIEHLMLTWNAVVVCDPAPYSIKPKQLAQKYRNFYICYFKETQTLDILNWKGKVVYADRTRIIDVVANEINDGTQLFRQRPHELEDLIEHWENLYRLTVEDDKGRPTSHWYKKSNRQSDYPFAMAYARIALTKVLQSGRSSFLEAQPLRDGKVTDTIGPSGTLHTTLPSIVEQTLEQMR